MRNGVIIICSSIVGGLLLWSLRNNIPFIKRFVGNYASISSVSKLEKDSVAQKKVNIYFFKEGKIVSELVEVVWSAHVADNLKHLVNAWLNSAYGERLIEQKTNLDDAAIASSGEEAYISFDRSFIGKNWSIEKKWQTIEGLLKTIRETSLGFSSLFFLVAHQSIEDDHLDLSQGWPIAGFLTEG